MLLESSDRAISRTSAWTGLTLHNKHITLNIEQLATWSIWSALQLQIEAYYFYYITTASQPRAISTPKQKVAKMELVELPIRNMASTSEFAEKSILKQISFEFASVFLGTCSKHLLRETILDHLFCFACFGKAILATFLFGNLLWDCLGIWRRSIIFYCIFA